MELKRKWLLVIGVLFLTLAGTNAFAADVTITTSATAVLDNAFDADLVISGSDTVGAFDLTVTYDPAKVQITGLTPGDGFSGPAQSMIDAANATDGTGGTLALSYLDVTLAGFTPAADGTTAFTFSLTPSSTDAQSFTPGGTLTSAGFPSSDVTGNLTALNFTAVDSLPVTVSASVDPAEGGGISDPGDKEWFEGDTPTYTITVNDGYRISSLLVDDADALSSLNDNNEYTFAALTAPGPHTIVAGFTRVYDVTTSASPAEGGSIASGTGSDSHDAGTSPDYTITINDGYAIDTFTVDGTDTSLETAGTNTATYTVSSIAADTALAVTFVPVYTVTTVATPTEGGSIDCGGTEFTAGSTPTCNVTVNDGYRVDQFTVDTDSAAVLTDNAYTFPAIGANATVTVTFMAQYDVDVTVTGDGTAVSESGENTFDAGATPKYTITAAENNRIVSITVDGTAVDVTDAYTVEYTFGALAADATLAVVFQPDAHDVTFEEGEGGEIKDKTEPAWTVTETGISVSHGSNAELKAAPNDGYFVTQIVVDGETKYEHKEGDAISNDGETFTLENVTSAMTVAATFDRIPTCITTIATPFGVGRIIPVDVGMVEPGLSCVEYGAEVKVDIVSNTGWMVEKVTKVINDEPVDVTSEVEDGVLDLGAVISDVIVDVKFKRDPDYNAADFMSFNELGEKVMASDNEISITELTRMIQLYGTNNGAYHCFDPMVDAEKDSGEGGLASGANADLQACGPANFDYDDDKWVVSLSELLRIIQFFTLDGYRLDVDDIDPTADGFIAGKE